MHGPTDATLLPPLRGGEREAFDRLFSLLYRELRQIAHQRLRRYRPGETFGTTALVHEAYLKLAGRAPVEWSDRAHFFALASRVMHSVLVNYAEARTALKRGGGVPPVPLEAVQVAVEEQATDLLALHQALEELNRVSPRLGRIVECRFFGGMSYEEIAEVMGVSVPTTKREWVRAKAWLCKFLQSAEA
jgi:RNA polymerase sigma factor (TIGR02999 family)